MFLMFLFPFYLSKMKILGAEPPLSQYTCCVRDAVRKPGIHLSTEAARPETKTEQYI
jgi:hypothetical protein